MCNMTVHATACAHLAFPFSLKQTPIQGNKKCPPVTFFELFKLQDVAE